MTGITKVNHYLSLVKFSHTVFALPFAIVGYFLALKYSNTPFDWLLLAKVVLCMVFARNAAMAFNRYIDRVYDNLNPRTAVREIPSGVIDSKNAIVFVVINALLFIVTTYTINKICFYLSPVALAVVLGYSYTKRFTALCHLVLGLGLALAPIGAYLAVAGSFALLPVLFSFAVLFWVTGFDIIYALQDDQFDMENKLKSIPVYLGRAKALLFSKFLHLLSAASVFAAGLYSGLGFYYWIGSTVFSGLLVYQHTLVKPTDLSKVNQAFFTTNGIASVVFAVFVLLSIC
jgi:4-hydroxybenzoate polyprenyltransferase